MVGNKYSNETPCYASKMNDSSSSSEKSESTSTDNSVDDDKEDKDDDDDNDSDDSDDSDDSEWWHLKRGASIVIPVCLRHSRHAERSCRMNVKPGVICQKPICDLCLKQREDYLIAYPDLNHSCKLLCDDHFDYQLSLMQHDTTGKFLMKPTTNGVIDSSCMRCFPRFPTDVAMAMTDAKAKVMKPASSVKKSAKSGGVGSRRAVYYYGRDELADPLLVRWHRYMSTLGKEVSIPQFDDMELKVRPETSNRGFMSGAMGLLLYREILMEEMLPIRWVTPQWFQSKEGRKARYAELSNIVLSSEDLREVRDRLSVSINKEAIVIMPCTKLSTFGTNLKRKMKAGEWDSAENYDALNIYNEQKKWLSGMGFPI